MADPPHRPLREVNKRFPLGAPRHEAPRPCFVAFTWATSSDGEILSRAAGTFTTVDEARQYLGRVRTIWLEEQDRWAVFKLPQETGRGALVAAGTGGDLSGGRRRATESDPA